MVAVRASGAIVLLVLAILLSGCGQKPAASPKTEPAPIEATRAYWRALAEGDCSALKKVVVAPADVDCGWVNEASASGELSTQDVDAAKYKVINQSGGAATVTIRDSNGEVTDTDLVEQGGNWLVVEQAQE